MVYIKCIVFRPSGSYYTDEQVYIRDNVLDFDVPQHVYQNREMENMVYVGKTPAYNVPFLVRAI